MRVPKASELSILWPALIYGSASVDALQRVAACAVRLEEPVSTQEVPQPCDIGELQVVLGQGITQVGHADVAAFQNAIRQLLDHFLASHPFGHIFRLQANLLEDTVDDAPQTLPSSRLNKRQGTLQQRRNAAGDSRHPDAWPTPVDVLGEDVAA